MAQTRGEGPYAQEIPLHYRMERVQQKGQDEGVTINLLLPHLPFGMLCGLLKRDYLDHINASWSVHTSEYL